MPSPIDQLQAAGFSDDEVGQWAKQQRTTLSAAGFGDDEIDHYLGGPKPQPSEAFLSRVNRWVGLNGLFDRIGKAGVDAFAASTAGPFDPQAEQWAREVGLFNDPAKGQVSPIRTVNEAAAKSTATAFRVLGGMFNAGVAEIGAGAGGLASLVTTGQAKEGGERIEREASNLVNFLGAQSMASGGHILTRPEISPTGDVHDAPIGAMPEREDFAAAAKVASGLPAPPPEFRAKIEALWQDKGVHPAEVAHDAERDPTIAQDLAASGPELPRAYGGGGMAAPAPAATRVGEPIAAAIPSGEPEIAPAAAPTAPPVGEEAPTPAAVPGTEQAAPAPPQAPAVALTETATRLEDMRLAREGIVPDEFARPNFFANKVPTEQQATPSALRSFAPSELRVDPERFQFKADTGAAGVSERLQGIAQWDPLKAGMALAYEDADGSRWIVDGHQRLALAKRIADADPAQQPRLNTWVVRAADGVTDAEARAVAAAKNIAEGTGTPVDAAKVLRDRPDLLPTLPPRSELVRQAQGLMKLDAAAFGKVVNDVVPPNYAAIVGRLVPEDGAMQNALVDLLAKTDPENATQAEAIVRQGLDAGLHKETQATLFGDEEVVSSLYGQRAKILDRALKQLRRDRIVFSSIVDNQKIIEELGNQLAQDENARRAATDGQAVQILQTLANRRGPLGDALTAAARTVADGSADLPTAARDFVAEIRRQAQGGALIGLADGGSRSAVAAAEPRGTHPPRAAAAAGPERNAPDVTPAQEARASSITRAAIAPAIEETGGLPATEQTAQGEQLVIPGAERSARQAAEAREAEGHGRIAPPAEQQEPGGLFAPPEPPPQPGLFERLLKEEGGAVNVRGLPRVPTPAEAAILDRISIGEHTDKRPWTWSRLYTNVVDRLYPLSAATSRAAGELGREIPTADNPYQLARLMSGVAGKADHFLNFGTVDWTTYDNTGAGLKQILAPGEDDLNGLRAFAASVRALELEHRGIETGMNLGAAREVAASGIDRYGGILAQLIDYQDKVAGYLRDSGVLSRAGYDAMREANRLYVPFNRVFSDADAGGFAGPSLQPRNPLQRIKGSERMVVDPIESIIRNTYLYVAMAERNAVGTALVDMLHEAGDAHAAIRDVSEAHLRDAVASPATQFADRPVVDVDGSVLPPTAPRQADLFPERGPIPREAEPAATPSGTTVEADVRQAIHDLLREQGLSDELFDFMAQAAAPPSENEIAIFRDGRREVWAVDRDIAGAVKALDRQSVGAIEALLAKPASWLRAGAVLNPDFQIRHTFRDYLYAAITGAHGFFSPVDMARGFIGLIARDEDFQNWLKAGGGNISRVALDRRYLQESLRELNGQTGLMVRAWNVIADPDALYSAKAKEVAALPFRAADKFILNPLRMVTELVENASHLGAFKQAMREAEATGAVGKPEIQAAGFASRDIAVDASRIGASMRAYNMITAFANITIQDTDRVARAFVERPLPTALKIAAGISLPSALLFWANHDDPDYWEIPQWERDMFWIIPVGSTAPSPAHIQQGQERGAVPTPSARWFFRLPKPWGMGITFGSGTERTLQALMTEQPDAFRNWAHSIAGTVVPNMVPTAPAPLVDQFANRSSFTNRTLIPAQLEKQLPEYQYTPYTTETAKKIAGIIAAFPGVRLSSLGEDGGLAGGVARALTTPVLLENYLRGWTGNLGVYALNAADAGLRKTGLLPDPPRPADTLADIPVVKAFVVRYPSASAESVQRFYDDYTRNKAFFATWMARAQEGDATAMEHIQAAGGPRMFVQLDSIQQALGEHSKLIRDIWKNPEMQPEEKRQLIDQVYYSEIQIARAGRDQMQAIDRELAATH